VEKAPGSPSAVGDSDALDTLLGRALSGDAEAAHCLVALLESDHHDRVTARMGYLKTGARTQTIEDAFQDTILRLMQRLRSGELRNLAAVDRENILQYFQRLCDGRLRDVMRERVSPVLNRRKEALSERLVDPHARVPGIAGQTEHLALIHEAISGLEPEHERILRCYLEGVPQEEIARDCGRTIDAIKNVIVRLKKDLQLAIVPRSATAKLKFEEEQAKTRRWPSRAQIDATLAVLPPEIKEAAIFVHVKRRSVEDLARTLGDRGFEKAQARLKQAYRSLSGKLKAPFPEAFEKARP
jgi:RNA polymerase sigma factor (sigma-70 family)